MNTRLFAALAASLTLIGCTSAPLPAPAGTGTAAAEDALAAKLDALDFSGTLLVSKGGKVVRREAVNDFPQALEPPGTGPVTPDTKFVIASMSKSFTAALVLDLVDDGKLSLDQTLSELLPDFDVPYADEVTLRQLLQNRSGIPHYISIPGWFDNDVKRAFTPDSFMDTLEQLELQFPPGSDYLYSNVNYYLLALIIDRHAGMTYEAFLQERILTPLGMASTGQIYEAGVPLAANYLRNDDGTYEALPIINPALFRGAGSMYSSADDLRAWGEAVIAGRIYSAAASREAFNPETPMAWSVSDLELSEEKSAPVLYYNGRLIGYLSLILLLPEEDGVIVVLNNNTAGYENMVDIGTMLAAQYFGDAD